MEPVWTTIHEKQHRGLWLLGLDENNPPPDNRPVNKLLWGGAGGAGKGEFQRMVATEVARQWPRSKGAIFRRKTTDVYATHVKPLLAKLPKDAGSLHTVLNHLVYTWANGSETEFHHCVNPDDYWSYGSYEWDWIGIDEVTQFTVDQILYLCSRVRSTRPGWWPIHVFTTNPPGISQQYFLDNFVDGHEDEDYPVPFDTAVPGSSYIYRCAYQPATLYDNPSIPYEIAMAGMQSIADPIIREAIATGNWRLTQDTFFSTFRRHTHVIKPFPIPDDWIVWRGLDWGYSAPFGCLWAARNPADRVPRTYISRELFQPGLTDYQQAKRVLELSEGDPHCRMNLCDPSVLSINRKGIVGPNHGAEWQRAGLTHLVAANNRRPLGWARVHKALATDHPGGPELQIFDTCTELIKELSSAKRHPSKYEDIKEPDNPGTGRDELLDCIDGEAAVLVWPGIEKPMSLVSSDDLVLTRGGWAGVKNRWLVGTRDCVTAHLSNGRSLTGTPDHRVWVQGKGWGQLINLRYGDILETCQDQRQSFLPGSSSVGTPTLPMLPTVTTTLPPPTIGGPAWAHYTRKSGSPSMVQSPPVTTYTTTTATTSTTIPPTSFVSQPEPTSQPTASPTPLPRKAAPVSSGWRKLAENWRRSGTALRQAARGIASTLGKCGIGYGNINLVSPVSNAEFLSRHQSAMDGCVSAAITANPPGAATPDSMTRRELALSVGLSSASTSTPESDAARVSVLFVEEATARPVYDIEVEDQYNHEFICQGVLVHNCTRYLLMGAAPASRRAPRDRGYRVTARR